MKYIDLNKNRPGNKKKLPLTKKQAFFLGLIAAVAGLLFSGRLNFGSLLTPVSVFSQIVNPRSLEQTDGHTNFLILGVDRRSNAGFISGVLTDTIMMTSLDPKRNQLTSISLPRDLWVKYDNYSSGKINAAYALGGVELTKKIVGQVLGVPMHYFAVIDFQSFEEAIDILGGIDIEVENTFDDYRYPVFGKELDECDGDPELKCRYEHLHFDKSYQRMDGKTALAFARSRYAEGPEGGDFARMRRQQKVMDAVKNKILSLKLLTDPAKIKELYNLFTASLETDIGWGEIEALLQFSGKAASLKTRFHLIDGSWDSENALLYTPKAELYGGAFVLVPKAGDYSEIHYFVQKVIFGMD